jgi:hypothetical protein
MFNFLVLLAAGPFVIDLALAALTESNCTREFLMDAVNSYITAQTTGLNAIKALSSSVLYTKNDKARIVSIGSLAIPLKIDHNRSESDTTACATYTELIITKK